MLVISRKKGESILIGDNIEVTVIKIEEGNIKLAISAPRDVGILRKELYLQVEEENHNAIEVNLDILKTIKDKA